MTLDRREFLTAAAGVAAASLAPSRFDAPIAFAEAPDPNDPNDPNAITDPDHEIGKPYAGWR
ncbi:MAG: twin-arginine translocation signal domain-containing protein, partial [Thermoguttaceae bacterium]|nr:twin-arginine translocation signal domain-containing protein [Thermoguttaceae bacterium]